MILVETFDRKRNRASAIAALKVAVNFGEPRDVRHATVALGVALRPRHIGRRIATAFRFAAMLLRASGRTPESVLGEDYRRLGVIR